jgi:hypothetical protein
VPRLSEIRIDDPAVETALAESVTDYAEEVHRLARVYARERHHETVILKDVAQARQSLLEGLDRQPSADVATLLGPVFLGVAGGLFVTIIPTAPTTTVAGSLSAIVACVVLGVLGVGVTAYGLTARYARRR